MLTRVTEEDIIQEYFGPIAINATSDDRGNGLYATRDIKKGEILICEKSFANSF